MDLFAIIRPNHPAIIGNNSDLTEFTTCVYLIDEHHRSRILAMYKRKSDHEDDRKILRRPGIQLSFMATVIIKSKLFISQVEHIIGNQPKFYQTSQWDDLPPDIIKWHMVKNRISGDNSPLLTMGNNEIPPEYHQMLIIRKLKDEFKEAPFHITEVFDELSYSLSLHKE